MCIRVEFLLDAALDVGSYKIGARVEILVIGRYLNDTIKSNDDPNVNSLSCLTYLVFGYIFILNVSFPYKMTKYGKLKIDISSIYKSV